MKVIKFAIDVASGSRDFVLEQNYVKRKFKGLDGIDPDLEPDFSVHAAEPQRLRQSPDCRRV